MEISLSWYEVRREGILVVSSSVVQNDYDEFGVLGNLYGGRNDQGNDDELKCRRRDFLDHDAVRRTDQRMEVWSELGPKFLLE